MTVGGIPSIYYGDEQAFTGAKENRIGGDDAIRPPFPDSSDDLAPWGEHVHRAHQNLIGLRRRHPWLTTATTHTTELTNTRMIYRTTASDGSDHLDIELDLSDHPHATIRDRHNSVLWTT